MARVSVVTNSATTTRSKSNSRGTGGPAQATAGPDTALAPTYHDKGEAVVMAEQYLLTLPAVAPATDLHMRQRGNFPNFCAA